MQIQARESFPKYATKCFGHFSFILQFPTEYVMSVQNTIASSIMPDTLWAECSISGRRTMFPL